MSFLETPSLGSRTSSSHSLDEYGAVGGHSSSDNDDEGVDANLLAEILPLKEKLAKDGQQSEADTNSIDSEGRSEPWEALKQTLALDRLTEAVRKKEFAKFKNGPQDRVRDYRPGGDDVEIELVPLNDYHNDDIDNGGASETAELEFTDLSNIDVEATDGSIRSVEPGDENSVENGELETERTDEWECPELPIPFVSGIITFLVHKVRGGIKAWSNFSVTKRLIVILIVLMVLGLLLFVSLFPASFVYVEYHEYAFARNKVTWKIDYSDVYDEGCYLLAPQIELVRLQATAHFLELNIIVTSSAALDIELQIMLQYFLKRKELEQLYKKYYFGYDSVIKTLVESTVKNTAVHFSLDEFRLERKKVEAEIFKNVKYVLSGNCCDPCCPYDCAPGVNCRLPNCSLIPRGCYPGHHVEIKYFQLGKIGIPDEIMNRFIKRTILKVEAEREDFYQAKAMEVKKTEFIVKKIRNQAEEIIKEAKAKERVIVAEAESERFRDVQLSYQKALKKFFAKTNVTSEEIKCSFMLTKALEEMSDNLVAYNYEGNTAFTPA